MLRVLIAILTVCANHSVAATSNVEIFGSHCSGFGSVEKVTGSNTYALFLFLDDAGATAYGMSSQSKNCIIHWNFELDPGEAFEALDITAHGMANFEGRGQIRVSLDHIIKPANSLTSYKSLRSHNFPSGVAQWSLTGTIQQQSLSHANQQCGASLAMMTQITMDAIGKSINSYTDIFASLVQGSLSRRGIEVFQLKVTPCE